MEILLIVITVVLVLNFIIWKLLYRHNIKTNEKIWAQIFSNMELAMVDFGVAAILMLAALVIRMTR
jgi:hypothetical protein